MRLSAKRGSLNCGSSIKQDCIEAAQATILRPRVDDTITLNMRKPIVIRSLAVLFMCAGVWIARTQQPPAQPLELQKVTDDLYNISGSGGNVAVYLTDEGVILV